jgi:proteic killer suppression protein
MIKSFKHKGLKKFFETGNTAGINPAHRQKIRMRLAALDSASVVEDMDLPGFRLHTLKGDKQGLWAIDVNKNWRITFEFIDGDAYIVNYEDYH